MTSKDTPEIHFGTKLFAIGARTILRVPETASQKLPSRGQVMVVGTINGHKLQTPLEPDGKWSHWFEITADLQKTIGASAGDTVTLTIAPTKNWPEPDVPTDLQKAIAANPTVHELWQHITPMARWEWVRWLRSTNSTETRQRRIAVAISKMESGERRPCCWNRNACTDPSVSKNGVLLALE